MVCWEPQIGHPVRSTRKSWEPLLFNSGIVGRFLGFLLLSGFLFMDTNCCWQVFRRKQWGSVHGRGEVGCVVGEKEVKRPPRVPSEDGF